MRLGIATFLSAVAIVACAGAEDSALPGDATEFGEDVASPDASSSEEVFSDEGSLAESSVVSWDKAFGGTGDDFAGQAIQTVDGGYIIAGGTKSKGAGGWDAWVLRLDGQGKLLWDRTFGGADDDGAYSVLQTADGGHIVAGYTKSKGAGGWDAWVLRLDGQGKLLWDRTFGGADDDGAYSILQTADGGYIVAGYTKSKGAGGWDAWVLRLDGQGKLLWDKAFGGVGDETAYSINQTADLGLVIAGVTSSKGAGSWDAWVLCLDAQWQPLWDKTFGGSGHDEAFSVQQTPDGGYIVVGSVEKANNWDAWVLRLDGEGEKLWDKTFGGKEFDEAWWVQQTSDGGHIVAGVTLSKGAGLSDAWLFRLDDGGELLWDRSFGGIGHDQAENVMQTDDGGYIVAGSTRSRGTGDLDAWVLKLDRNGRL
jgi:hypothetical protein